jgi:hypothetical protein
MGTMPKTGRRRQAARGTEAGILILLLAAGPARADLHFDQTTVHAGVIRSGPPHSQRYCFTNQSSTPIEIVNVRGSCGCLKPRLEKTTYQPGERGAVLLELNTLTADAGDRSWQVYVQYRSAGVVREAALSLIGQVTTEVMVQPAALTVNTDQRMTHEMVLTDQRPRPLAITELRTSSPGLKGHVGEQLRDEQGRWVRKINLEVAVDFPEGRHDEVLDIITDDPLYRDLKVPVTVVKRSRQRLSTLPARVTLRAVGQSVPSRIVLLRDNDGGAVVVQKAEPDHPAIRCAFARGPNRLSTLRITIDRAKAKSGRIQGVVRVQLAEPAGEVLTVPVSCELDLP